MKVGTACRGVSGGAVNENIFLATSTFVLEDLSFILPVMSCAPFASLA